jgi:hypothetical protein
MRSLERFHIEFVGNPCKGILNGFSQHLRRNINTTIVMSILLISDDTPLKYQFNRKLIAPTYNASEHTMLVSLPYANRVCGI